MTISYKKLTKMILLAVNTTPTPTKYIVDNDKLNEILKELEKKGFIQFNNKTFYWEKINA